MGNKTTAVIVTFIVGVLIGFLLKDSLSTFSQLQAKSRQEAQLKEKIQTLSDQEIAEYYELKNDAEKVRKADEILAKMITIFLHDLGIKVSKKTLTQNIDTLNKDHIQSTTLARDTSMGLKKETTDVRYQARTESPIASWRSAERLRYDIKTEKDSADFLEKVSISDFDAALSDAKAFGNRTGNLPYLRGRFVGKADVKLNEKYQTWDVDLVINGSLEKGSFQGTASIRMFRDGKIFSNSSDNGTLRSFKEFNSGSDSILIRASPTEYFQMYFLKDKDAFIGNVYKRNEEENPYRRVGTVQLRRGN